VSVPLPPSVPRLVASSGPYGTNASPAGEVGTEVGSAATASYPGATLYDPADGYVYALCSGSSTGVVSILNGTRTLANLSIGPSPWGMAYDAAHGYVDVGNYANGNGHSVAVFNGTRLVENVTVGQGPIEQVYEPRRGWDYSIGYPGTVTVLNGTQVVSTLSLSDGLFYGAADPSNGWVYVTNDVANQVMVINGTKLVGALGVAQTPIGIAADPANGWVYVATGDAVTVFNGTKTVGTASVGGSASMVVYDPVHRLMYVSNQNNYVSVLNGTKVVATVDAKGGGFLFALAEDPASGMVYFPFGSDLESVNGTTFGGQVSSTDSFGFGTGVIAYDPEDADLFLPAGSNAQVLLFSTALALGAPLALPSGNPAGSVDVGQPVVVTAPLWAVGTGSDTPSVEVLPYGGLGCSGSAGLGDTGGQFSVQVGCTPTSPGDYALYLNVTDGSSQVWARANLTVFADPSATAPTASAGSASNVSEAAVGEAVTFREAPQGGTGNYSGFNWTGLPDGASCGGNGTAQLTCSFARSGRFSLSVALSDSNGARSGPSPSLSFLVGPALAVGAPGANRTSADVGQPVTFHVAASGGSGSYARYRWAGLPDGACLGSSTDTVNCTFTEPAALTVSVGVTDSFGASADGPSAPFTVYGPPTVSTPQVSRTTLDEGQAVNFSTIGAGGVGELSYAWRGLPDGCTQGTTAAPRCVPDKAGSYTVAVQAFDANQGASGPSDAVAVIVYSDPSVATPTVSSTRVTVGDPLTISTMATGGSGDLALAWSGLPPGCAGATGQLTCRPSASGIFEVSVAVSDSDGFTSYSAQTQLVVVNATAPPGAMIDGLPYAEFVGVAVGLGMAAAAAGAILAFGRRRRRR
jgi:DNA-binding beta-propeller fold protein YncE